MLQKNIRKALTLAMAILLATSLLFAASTSQSLAVTKKIDSRIKVMTWNVYDGANLAPLLSATTRTAFFTAVATAYNGIVALNFPERAEAIATEVEDTSPDLIALQEAILLRTQVPADGPATPATDITYDYIQILLDKLAERGLHYKLVVSQDGTDVEAPGLFSTGLKDVRLTDRDAILVREGLKGITLSNDQGANFVAKLTVTTLVGEISFPKSWVSVDLSFGGGSQARLVSTHLEPLSPTVQVAQAAELLSGPGNTALPLILIGDYNSKADGTGTQTYSNLIGANFVDSWMVLGEGSGFTCCQNANLLNTDSTLATRIDLILFKGNFKVQEIGTVGDAAEDKTTSGLWPSDHAGVFAELKLTTNV